MREIKFKAVMERIDGAIYVSDGYGADSGFLSYLFDFEDNRWDRFLKGIITEQRFVLLFPDDDEDVKGWSHIENTQWTGLLDKNGVEIYEGDIVNFQRIDAYVYMTNVFQNGFYRGVVKWGEHYPGFDIFDIKDNSTFGFDCNIFSMESDIVIEVIGSIYENPELLNDELKAE